MKTDLHKVVAITGYAGLFRHLAQNKNGMIIESLTDGKRMCTAPSMRVSTLADVAIYTDAEELALREVLIEIKEKLNGEAAIPHKSPEAELRKFFEEIIPDYDRERFYPSHMKKVLEWYNILQSKDLLDFEDDEPAAEPSGEVPVETTTEETTSNTE
jgi:hypothetical protein